MNQTLNLVVTEPICGEPGWSIGLLAGVEKHFYAAVLLGFYASGCDG
jgi:hypothetical protein